MIRVDDLLEPFSKTVSGLILTEDHNEIHSALTSIVTLSEQDYARLVERFGPTWERTAQLVLPLDAQGAAPSDGTGLLLQRIQQFTKDERLELARLLWELHEGIRDDFEEEHPR